MQWYIGNLYMDTKRDELTELVAVTPYKNGTGRYLDFKYLNTERFIRQRESKAIERFKGPSGVVTDASTGFMDAVTRNAVNGLGAIANKLSEPIATPKASPAPKQRPSKKPAIDWTQYPNVIWVDFKKRCRIFKGVL